MLECRVSPSPVTSSTHHSASAAERIAFLNSGPLGPAIHPIGSEQEISQSKSPLPCAKFRASPAGIYRSPTPQPRAAKKSAATNPVRSSNAARYLAVFGVDASAQGGVHRIRVISPIRVVSRGVLFGARFTWNWICGCLHARQPWHRSDHAAGTRLFRGSDKAANLLPIALNILWESRTAERFRARDWVITSATAEHSPDRECPVFLGRF